MMWSITSPH